MPDPALPARIQTLLNRFPPSGREKTWYPNGADERSLLLWQYFCAHPDEALPLRFAHGLAWVMNRIAIAIHEDELIVGEVGLEDEALRGSTELAQALTFWQERSESFNRSFAFQAEERLAASHGLSWKWCSRDGHAIPAFDSLLRQGLGGLAQTARSAAAQAPEEDARQVYWQAMITALEALSAYMRRYAALAGEMARPRRGRSAGRS